jgi:Tfp pilus assembly protein PilF
MAPGSPAAPMDAAARAALLQHALDLLQSGDANGADVALHTYLKDAPDSKAAAFLIAQIEKPLSDLFPADSFTIKLSHNDSLSSLAKTYLGDSLSFYGLARYNNIRVPGKVSEGQTLRIPRTAESLQALARITAAAAAPQPAAVSTLSKSPKPADNSRKLADVYYQRGLVAFQHQDLNTAIADWDKVLAIDPNHKDAQLSRAQAVRLKNNLAKLRK